MKIVSFSKEANKTILSHEQHDNGAKEPTISSEGCWIIIHSKKDNTLKSSNSNTSSLFQFIWQISMRSRSITTIFSHTPIYPLKTRQKFVTLYKDHNQAPVQAYFFRVTQLRLVLIRPNQWEWR